MDLGFKDVHVLVTGAAGAIGFAITKLFLEQGALVTGHYNSKLGPLEDAQKLYKNLHIAQGDLTTEEAVKNVFSVASESWQQEVQVLVLNHGIFSPHSVDLVDMELSQWNRCVDVNLTSSFLVARQFLKHLRSPRPGREPDLSKVAVVVIGANSGEWGEEGYIEYASTKSAVQTGFVQTLKYEIVKIAPAGRVNAVSPGFVKTEMAEPILKDKQRMKEILNATPLNRVAAPEDVAYHTLMLASWKASAHVTGTNVIMTGGLIGRVPPSLKN